MLPPSFPTRRSSDLGALEVLAELVGIASPPNALFFVAFGFVLVLLLHFSVAVSRLTDQSKVLAQRLALLEERVGPARPARSEEHTSELQSPCNLVRRLHASPLFPYTTLFRSRRARGARRARRHRLAAERAVLRRVRLRARAAAALLGRRLAADRPVEGPRPAPGAARGARRPGPAREIGRAHV